MVFTRKRIANTRTSNSSPIIELISPIKEGNKVAKKTNSQSFEVIRSLKQTSRSNYLRNEPIRWKSEALKIDILASMDKTNYHKNIHKNKKNKSTIRSKAKTNTLDDKPSDANNDSSFLMDNFTSSTTSLLADSNTSSYTDGHYNKLETNDFLRFICLGRIYTSFDKEVTSPARIINALRQNYKSGSGMIKDLDCINIDNESGEINIRRSPRLTKLYRRKMLRKRKKVN